MKRLLTIVLLLAVVLAAGLAWLVHTRVPEPLPDDLDASTWARPGTDTVGYDEVTLVDTSRPTEANGDYPGAPQRTLETSVWYPLADKASTDVASGRHPLIVYSHGFSSNRRGGAYLARFLASHGYVVISADFPLTHMRAPDGPQLIDVANQPGDVRFLLDTALQWNRARGHLFHQRIDPERLGVMGLSLGGMTSTLVSFHPRLRDPRLKGAISIAGPSSMFGPRFFSHADVPFLMIAGTVDALVPYDRNAAPMPRKLPGSLLMSIEGATHTGFADAARWLRWLDNPDSLGCAVVKRRNPASSADGFYQRLGGADIGMIEDRKNDLCVQDPLPPAMNPLRQHRLTRLGVFAFWESLMAPSAARRRAARRFLVHTLPREQPAVTVQGG